MVLVVIAHVQAQTVDRTVVAVGLLIGIIGIMLLDPTRTHRVEPDGEEKGEDQVKKAGPAAEINHCNVIRHGAQEVDREPTVPHCGNHFEARRPGQLKEWKQHQPDRLTVPFVADQARFPMIGQVRVVLVIALMGVMAQMIKPKTHRTWIQIWKIGENCNEVVPAFSTKD
jgi:hypothetical protein